MTIRFALPADAPTLLAIYAPYITETAISFEYEVPTADEFAGRIRAVQQQQLPYLVAETPERVLGYAYASRHQERAAYQWSVNTSVYVHPDGHRQGVGRALYVRLLDLLRQQGYYNAYAGITLPNVKSEAFHRTMGFETVGVYEQVGYKFGAWHSVLWLQRLLQPRPLDPARPTPLSGLA